MMNTSIPKNHICITSSQSVNEIANPLFLSTGLNFFSYARDYYDKTMVSLQTNDTLFQSCFENRNPYISLHVTDGVYLWDDLQNEGLIRDTRAMDFGNGICLIKHHQTYSEVIGLNAPVNKLNVMQLYLNNFEAINKFIMYFKDKASKLINKAVSNPISLPDFMVNPSASVEVNKTSVKDLTKFKKSLNINKYYFNEEFHGVKLTDRELQCLNFYLKGKTASQIALELGLHKATIDSFLLNIKKKFNCKKSSELFDLFWKLGILSSSGYLDI